MKKLAVIAAAVLVQVSVFAADDPVAEFEGFLQSAQKATDSQEMVYLNHYNQKWAKRKFSTTDVKYDVKKTDSLVNPIVGVVSMNLRTEQTDLFPTKEEAQSATVFEPRFTNTYRISLNYSHRTGKWALSKGSYESMRNRATFEVTEEGIKKEPMAVPTAALLNWLPK